MMKLYSSLFYVYPFVLTLGRILNTILDFPDTVEITASVIVVIVLIGAEIYLSRKLFDEIDAAGRKSLVLCDLMFVLVTIIMNVTTNILLENGTGYMAAGLYALLPVIPVYVAGCYLFRKLRQSFEK